MHECQRPAVESVCACCTKIPCITPTPSSSHSSCTLSPLYSLSGAPCLPYPSTELFPQSCPCPSHSRASCGRDSVRPSCSPRVAALLALPRAGPALWGQHPQPCPRCSPARTGTGDVPAGLSWAGQSSLAGVCCSCALSENCPGSCRKEEACWCNT